MTLEKDQQTDSAVNSQSEEDRQIEVVNAYAAAMRLIKSSNSDNESVNSMTGANLVAQASEKLNYIVDAVNSGVEALNPKLIDHLRKEIAKLTEKVTSADQN